MAFNVALTVPLKCWSAPVRLAFDLRKLVRILRFWLRTGAVSEFDGKPLGAFRRHLREDFRHLARIDLGRDLDQYLQVEAIEDAGGVFRLHVLVHGDDALEAVRLGLVAIAYCGVD